MFARATVWAIAATLVASCSGWNSELDTAHIPDGNPRQKLKCAFQQEDNCWTRSVDLLMACVQPVTDGEIFTDDLRFCRNETGKMIEFVNPLDIAASKGSQEVEFNVYNGNRKCFRFKGNRDSFEIDGNSYGTLALETLPNGSTLVSCFYNESFEISVETKTHGCDGLKGKLMLPQAQLQRSTAGGAKSDTPELHSEFSFFFQGMGLLPQAVFRCSR